MSKILRQTMLLIVLCFAATTAWALEQKDGVYQIGTAKDLYAFAQLVSNGQLRINGELTADIDATTGDFMPIGSTSALYCGRFNGQGHRVKININTTEKYQGLFGCVTGGALIMNTIVEGEVNANSYCAGLVGGSNRYGVVTILNCGNEANVTSSGSNPAGIIGVNLDTHASFVIRNCYNTGKISGKEDGAICGWASNQSIIENCYSIGESVNMSRGTVGENMYFGEEAREDGLLEKLGSGFQAGESYPIPTIVSWDEVNRKIGSEADLQKFLEDVNNGMTYLNGELTADIDASNCLANAVIGTSEQRMYSGVFDGKGHTLTLNMNRTESKAAPFGYSCGIVKNLVVDGTIETSNQFAASVVSRMFSPGEVRNVLSRVNFILTKAGDGTHGGIIATSNKGGTIIENCAFVGSMEGDSKACAGITGWSNSDYGKAQINNCYLTATFNIDNTDCNTITRHPSDAVINNCYFLNDLGNVEDGPQYIDEEMVTSGELCYLLNGNQKDIQWYQTLGDDDSPVPFSTSKRVYGIGELLCDGTSAGGTLTYSNENTSPAPEHDYVDGICSVCETLEPNYVPVVDDVYQISNGNQLSWFSRWVNSGNNTCDAVLTDDIDMDGQEDRFQPIGAKVDDKATVYYKGNFNGQGHTIKNLLLDWPNQYAGLFGIVSGNITIENLTLDENCSINGGAASVGLIGAMRDAGTVTMRCLGNKGEVMAAGVNAGGILGVNFSGLVVMDRCYVTGFISGANENGAISGWVGADAKVSNCWSIAEVYNEGGSSSNFSRQSSAKYTNCWSTIGSQVNTFDIDDAVSGRLCYMMNGNQSDVIWFQNIDEDDHPVPYNTHKQVYATPVRCDNLCTEESTFTNEKNSIIPAHSYVNGFCSICNHENPDAGFLAVIKNADFDLTDSADKAWEDNDTKITIINSVGEHYNHTFDTYQKVGDLENGVYALQVQGFYRLGKYTAEHYESGSLDLDKAPAVPNSYFYAQSDGIDIANHFMDITEGQQEEMLNNGGQEVMLEGTGFYIPDGTAGATKYFQKGLYRNPIRYVVVNAGDSLTLGMRSLKLAPNSWTCTDTWRLSYVGNQLEDYQKVKDQLLDNVEEFGNFDYVQTTLVDSYEKGVEALKNAASIEEILDAARSISGMPERIHASADQYEAFVAAMEEIQTYLDEHDDFTSAERTQLEEYFEAKTEPSDENPYGSYLYITEECLADGDSLASETLRIQDLLKQAIANGIGKGTDITHLIANADMSQKDFAGWNADFIRKEEGYNYSSGNGFADVFPVAVAFNSTFDVYQEIGGNLPDGVYELGSYALYRPGPNEITSFGPSFVIPCQVYMNDFYVPVKNIYTDLISYDDAVNGVNCRYDASGDESALHNGQETWSQDFDVEGEGYVPEGQFAAGFAFKGGRYYQKVFALVTDGKIRLGIRNTGNPWYDGGLAMWGAFNLKYMAKDLETEDEVFDSFAERLDNLLLLREDFEIAQYFSLAHADAINELIAKGKKSTSEDEKFELLKQINEEFKAIDSSIVLFKELMQLKDSFADEAGTNPNLDGATYDEIVNLCDEIHFGIEEGTLTDEQALDYMDQINNHPMFGTFYAVGDLVDPEAENGKTSYNENSYLYPIERIEGTNSYVGTFKMQDRSNQANSNGRAGVYFRFRGKNWKSSSDYLFFVTPGYADFKVDTVGHDFQMVGGEWKVEINMDDQSVHFTPVDEPVWSNKVYCVGTLKGASWSNDEQYPLIHQGDGLYTGLVELQRGTGNMNPDTKKPYCELTIFATRSSDSSEEDSKNGRSSWSEARYGSMTDKLPVTLGEKLDSLVRNRDRKWLIAEPGTYYVAFDMKNNCISIMNYQTGDVSGDGVIDGQDIVALVNYVIGNPARLSVKPAADVNNDTTIDGSDIVSEVNLIMNVNPEALRWLEDFDWKSLW